MILSIIGNSHIDQGFLTICHLTMVRMYIKVPTTEQLKCMVEHVRTIPYLPILEDEKESWDIRGEMNLEDSTSTIF